MLTTIDRAIGCMLGGAGGDSLGAAVEFISHAEILKRYGPNGVQDLQPAFRLPPGVITDDTQQAHAVAEGLILSALDGNSTESIRGRVWNELKRWHLTQSDPRENRSPGGTSMGSLSGQRSGTLKDPLNNSDSCGSVMRVHPVGIAFAGKPDEAFRIGMEVSVLTHGGSEAVTAGGAMAALISSLCDGSTLDEGLAVLRLLINRIGRSTLPITTSVLDLPVGANERRNMDNIGSGWDADDALAMGIYAARCFPTDYLEGVRFAVNHSGDSDSTGSMAGAILGATLGPGAVPRQWRDCLEGRATLTRVARALVP